MNKPNQDVRKPSKRVLLPRWMALILTPVVFLLGHVAVPQVLSEFSARHGWAHGGPGWLNLLGLIPIGAGFAGLVWCLRLHFVGTGNSFETEGTQNYLVVPWEERSLAARFGEAYLRYKNSVPQWLGKRSR
jgi:protein-S-isoprenylcysteine O-methyltransferase Ste14